MITTELIDKISAKDVDVPAFVRLAVEDVRIREEIIRLMVTHPHIMVYYHCYTVVEKASSQRPDLFYGFWESLVPLLNHPNSYHRDIGLTILANLTAVDSDDRFQNIVEEYLTHIHDTKFMTAQCFVTNCRKVIHHKPNLKGRIIRLLLDVDGQTTYPVRQKELLKADILEVLEGCTNSAEAVPGVAEFIRACAGSGSPKTRSKARQMLKQYG